LHTLDDSQPILDSSTADEKISLVEAVAKKLYPDENFLSSVGSSSAVRHLEMMLELLQKKLPTSNATAKTVVPALLQKLNAKQKSMTPS